MSWEIDVNQSVVDWTVETKEVVVNWDVGSGSADLVIDS